MSRGDQGAYSAEPGVAVLAICFFLCKSTDSHMTLALDEVDKVGFHAM